MYHTDRPRDLLALRPYTHPITMIPVDYTPGIDFKPAVRGPVEAILRWEQRGTV